MRAMAMMRRREPVVAGEAQQRRDDDQRGDERYGAAAIRRRLGEDRLHRSTIAAAPPSGICSRQMARAAPSKQTRKPATAATSPQPPRVARDTRDPRRWIYGGLDVGFAALYAIAIWKLIPNRLPSGQLHLWTLPLATLG